MTTRRFLAVVLVVVTTTVLEVAVMSRLGLPGATPDIVTIAVVGLAFVLGPGAGAMTGFAAGFVLDIAPPADGTVGVTALILAVVGYAAGSVNLPDERPMLPATLVVAGSAVTVVLLQAGIGTFLGDARVAWESVPWLMLTSAAYAAALSPLLLWVMWLITGRDEAGDRVLVSR